MEVSIQPRLLQNSTEHTLQVYASIADQKLQQSISDQNQQKLQDKCQSVEQRKNKEVIPTCDHKHSS